jgi:acetyltransferase-like isoleucine patch superfamily enzyme
MMKQYIKNIIKKWALNHPCLYRFLTLGGGKICIKGIGNQCVNDSLRFKGCTLRVKGNYNNIKIEKGVRMKNVAISVTGNNHKLIIKNNVHFIHSGRIRLEDMSNSIEIGEGSKIYNAFLSAGDRNTKILIGKDCLFSVDIILRTSDSHSIFQIEGKERINLGKNIEIGDHVWLCNGVNILKGVKIGNGSVVGTQSVVTKNIPSNSIACGNPAKIVRNDIRWDEKRIY